MTTQVIPSVYVHEIISGNKFEGEVPDVAGTEEALFRGRIQEWLGGTQGGEIAAPDHVGMRIEEVRWALTCTSTPDVSIYVVDDGDFEYLVHTENADSGSYSQTNLGFLIPPSFKLRVKSSVNTSAATAVASEDTGVTGDGISATYDLSFVATRLIVPGTVSIVANTVTFTDPSSDGVLVGTGAGGGSGTVDYSTGTAQITLNTPSDFNAVNALATYDYYNVGRIMVVRGQGWGQPVPSQVNTIGREILPPSMQRS